MAGDKERLPYLPVYVNDLTSDELVEAMSTEEFGAYMFLLFKAWKSEPPCTIPDDDQTLARYSRLPIKRWLTCKARILAPWKSSGEGRLVQKRLLKVHGEVLERINQKREAGAKGGRARAANNGAEKPSTAQAPLEAPLKHRLDFASSETPSTAQAEPKQSKSKTKNTSNDVFNPPNPPTGGNVAVVGIEIDGELVEFDQDPIRWVAEFVRQWNQLPGVRKHDHSALSSINLKALRDRLAESDWYWKRAFIKFPLWIPSGMWQLTLGTFLEPATVSKILDGKYEQRPEQTGLFGRDREDPSRVRTGATAATLADAMAKATTARGRDGVVGANP